MRKNSIVCGGVVYEIDAAYRAGAKATREGSPTSPSNPHRHGCYQSEQWNAGRINEAAGEHDRFGVDVICAQPVGQRFEEDLSKLRGTRTGDKPSLFNAQSFAFK